MSADHFTAAGRIEVSDFGNIDYKSPDSGLQSIQYVFAQAEERLVENHPTGEFDQTNGALDFGSDLHDTGIIVEASQIRNCKFTISEFESSFGDLRLTAP